MYPNPWKNMPDPYHRYIWQDDDYVFRTELPNLVPKEASALVAEFGIGNGYLLRQIASQHSNVFFLGVELYYKPLGQSAKRIHRAGLKNVQLIRYNALHPAVLFPDRFLDGIIVNFPEPWPKDRHHKNRIFYGPIAKHYKQILKPGGWVFLQTDQQAYYEMAIQVLKAEAFHIEENKFPFVMDNASKSYFQSLFEAKGDHIYRVHAKVMH